MAKDHPPQKLILCWQRCLHSHSRLLARKCLPPSLPEGACTLTAAKTVCRFLPSCQSNTQAIFLNTISRARCTSSLWPLRNASLPCHHECTAAEAISYCAKRRPSLTCVPQILPALPQRRPSCWSRTLASQACVRVCACHASAMAYSWGVPRRHRSSLCTSSPRFSNHYLLISLVPPFPSHANSNQANRLGLPSFLKL